MVGSATHENGRKEALMSGVMVKRWVGGSIKPTLGKVLQKKKKKKSYG
jgi:hypothetical protein